MLSIAFASVIPIALSYLVTTQYGLPLSSNSKLKSVWADFISLKNAALWRSLKRYDDSKYLIFKGFPSNSVTNWTSFWFVALTFI